MISKCNYLDAAIVEVACVSCQAEFACPGRSAGAEEYALHPAGDEEASPVH